MPSLPESGPTRMSTFSCSTSRRASSTALSGVESEPPYTISILMGSPVASPPVVAPPVWPAPSSSPPQAAMLAARASTRAASRIHSRLGRPSPGFRIFPPLVGFSRYPELSPGQHAGEWSECVASSFVLGDDWCVAGRVAFLGQRQGFGLLAGCTPPEARLERAGRRRPDSH